MKKSKVYTSILTIILSCSMTSCIKNYNCEIPYEHIHYYEDEDGLRRLIEGEKENKDYVRTEEYKELTDELKCVAAENLLSIEDNFDYFIENAFSIPEPTRKEYAYDYIYGPYYGYGLCWQYINNEMVWTYGYGIITDWHWEDTWRDIAIREYTSNKVKDITTKIKLYKYSSNGTFEEKYFDSIDEIEDGYKYFRKGELIIKLESDSYNLNPSDFENKHQKELTKTQ